MTRSRKLVIGQLALGKAERRRFTRDAVLDSLSLAADAAGLGALLFWPSGEDGLDLGVRRRARDLGLELYLWLPVLADAGIDPGVCELTEDAWGTRGHGASGAWAGLGRGDESFLFACPRSEVRLNAAGVRCRDELSEYDGVFLDRIRYPSFANGLESLFTCFCPRCRSACRDWEARRDGARELRRALARADAADLRKWGDMAGLFGAFGLRWADEERFDAVRRLVGALAGQARGQGRKVALDLFSPSLAPAVGQDYGGLALLCDWLKPMLYCRAKGPAGVPLELACLARGLSAWAPRLPTGDVMAFVSRSFGSPDLPAGPDALESEGIDEVFAGGECALAAETSARPVYPGFECVRHPDFDFGMTGEGVRRCLAVLSDAPGVVLSWNILYCPEPFLRLAGAF